jgi:hypothetical protein
MRVSRSWVLAEASANMGALLIVLTLEFKCRYWFIGFYISFFVLRFLFQFNDERVMAPVPV